MRIPYLSDLWDVLMPRRCACCGRRLLPDEDLLCLGCLAALPRVGCWGHDNPAEHRVFGRFAYEHGASFCYYVRESPFARLVQSAKYGDRPWVNAALARLIVAEWSEWPYDVDVIVPVPIHWRRRLRRGYNQSLALARTLGRRWHLPVETHCLFKAAYTTSQVGNSFKRRISHVEGSFVLRHAERLAGRHVLLVDDVLTSGATLMACAQALEHSGAGIRISFLTLGLSN